MDFEAGNSISLVRAATVRNPGLAVLVYSATEDPEQIRQAFAAGASAFVAKRDPLECLLSGVRQALDGRRYVSPIVAQALAAELDRAGHTVGEEVLSRQEQKVYRLLSEGYTSSEIGTQMGLSTRTIESYCSRIQTKLGLHGMAELRRHAIACHRSRSG